MTTEGEIKGAILDVLEAATGISAIFADQSATKPDYPYCTMRILSNVNQGSHDEWRRTNATGEREVVGFRTMVLDVNVFQAEGVEPTAFDYIQLFNRELNKVFVNDELWSDHNISIVDIGSGQNLTTVLETKYEDRFQMDLTISYLDADSDSPEAPNRGYSEDVGCIEKVELNEEIIEI